MVQTVTPQVVQVQSAWASKVNWAAGLAALLAMLNEILPLVPDSWKRYVTIAIVVIGGLLTIYLRTFQSTTITPSSAQQTVSAPDLLKAAGASENQITDALNAAQLQPKGTGQ